MYVRMRVHKRSLLVPPSACMCFLSESGPCKSGGVGGGYKVETNSSPGDEGRHNYVQFSS